MTQMTFTYDQLLKALNVYEAEAIETYPHRTSVIQLTVLAMQDFMQSKHTEAFRNDLQQNTLPGMLQVPMSIVNGSLQANSILDIPDNIALPSTSLKLRYEITYFSDNNESHTEEIRVESLAIAEETAKDNCNVLKGEWATVECLDKPKRSLPVIQEKLKL